MKRRGTFPPEQISPTELRGVWVPRPLKRDWDADGMCLVYTKGFENYALSNDSDDVYEMIEDICTDLERGEWKAMESHEIFHANLRGVRFHTAKNRKGDPRKDKGVVHVVVGIEWSRDDDGKLLATITYQRQFDGPPPLEKLAPEEEV